MATYKLIQDIEAEDKILGPLTLRQFIFALVAVFFFYMCFISIAKHLVFLLALFLPPALFCGFFALPFGRDQPTEIWALAKLRFWFKPRRRVWNQSGIREMVTITVPKKVERVLTNGLSQNEVESRLQALAQTIDSRGWATKHVASDMYTPPVIAGGGSDRLIGFDSLPQEVPSSDTTPGDDMLDVATNPIARQFDNMINQSSQTRRQELISQLNSIGNGAPAAAAAGPNTWFTGQTQPAAPQVPTVTGAVVDAGEDDSGLAARLAAQTNSRHVSFGNLRTVQPLGDQPPPAVPSVPPADPGTAASPTRSGTMTAPDDPAILSLARNDDLNVATLARQANKNRGNENRSPDEVVIPLH